MSALNLPSPKRIQKLDPTIVNRIAAGEVIHRPAHALKELLENAIDAGATSIQVSVKDGGLKTLVIQDNGCGIELEDLPIVCKRFTTSKLTSFEDLKSIATYGFRGEALASISHVAHLTIISRTSASSCAYRATYLDGVLSSERPGVSSSPRACAGNVGTTITVQDLFYNVKTRLKALHSKSKEHAHLLEVVSKYAIHNSGIAISLRKIGATQVEINTQQHASTLDNIRVIYGSAVAKELLELNVNEEDLTFSCFFTNPNFSFKKFNFLLFINHRLVESNALKRAFDTVFHPLLPKGMHPFIYLSLLLPPHMVDVNVHPTKNEVHMLNESVIIEKITERVQTTLMQANQSRHYQVQSLLPSAFPSSSSSSSLAMAEGLPHYGSSEPTTLSSSFITPPLPVGTLPVVNTKSTSLPISSHSSSSSLRPDYMVRTDAKASTLDAWFYRFRGHVHQDKDKEKEKDTEIDENVPWRELGLTSIEELQDEALNECDSDLYSILHSSTFVGFLKGPYSLMQSGTYLYLINIIDLCTDFFYLRCLALFSNFPPSLLSTPVGIESAALEVLSQEQKKGDQEMFLTLSLEQAAKKMVAHLSSHSEMLKDYFSIEIDSQLGQLISLPKVLHGYTIPTSQIPVFLVRLCTEVNWEEEKSCLKGILKELAYLFTPTSQLLLDEPLLIEHVIVPELKEFYPNRHSRKWFTEIANLHELYKVFERC